MSARLFYPKAVNTNQLFERRKAMMPESPRDTRGEVGERAFSFRTRSAEVQHMTRSFISAAAEGHSPTLWLASPKDRTLIEFVLEASEEENRVLKKMVVGLSEIILETFAGKK